MILQKIGSRLRTLMGMKKQQEQGIEEELRLHVDLLAEEFLSQGNTQKEAHRRAKESFGDLTDVMRDGLKERGQVPSRETESWLRTIWPDLRYATRLLWKSPLFAIAVVLTLALGIGADTAVFSVVHGILLKPLPYKNAARVVQLYQRNLEKNSSHMMNSPADLSEVKSRNDVFEHIAVYRYSSSTLTSVGDAEQISSAIVTNEFFATLGVSPEIGRLFDASEATAEGASATPVDDMPGTNAGRQGTAVLISESLWRRLFGADPNVLGKSLTLNGGSCSIIGVMPAGFHYPTTSGPYQTQIWIGGDVLKREQDSRGSRTLAAMALLKPGAKAAGAQRELDAISARLAQTYPQEDKGWGFSVVVMREDVVRDTRTPLLVLFAAVTLLLLIACANVANLLLTRAAGRRREIAIRAALGAGRSRLIRQLLTESLLLAITGGAAGTAAAWAGMSGLRASLPNDLPRTSEVQMSGAVLLFAVATSVLVGVLFGLIPAMSFAKQRLNDSLKESHATTSSGFRLLRHHRSRSVLVVAQVALSVVLLMGSGLLTKSFLRLISVNLGFQTDHVLTFWIKPPQHSYETDAARANYYRQVVERCKTLPGVQSAALTSFLALGGYGTTDYQIEGRPKPAEGSESEAEYKAISSGYFSTLRIPLLRGRFFNESDVRNSLPVVMINQAFAQREFPNEEAIGKKLKLDWSGEPPAREIIGIIGDTRDASLQNEALPQFYAPIEQSWVSPSVAFLLRTTGDPIRLVPGVRAAVATIEKNQPISAAETLDELYSEQIAEPRFEAGLIGIFSMIAVTLSAVGLFAVMAYSVSARTHEIGIRMAIGAETGNVVALVARQGIALVGAGLILGSGAAIGLSRLLASLLYGIQPNDAATLAEAAALLALAGLAACWIPARRATRVDPIIALRYE